MQLKRMAVVGLVVATQLMTSGHVSAQGLNVQPAGRVVQADEVLQSVVTSVPSPAPQAIPSWVTADTNGYGAQVTLGLDSTYQSYTYDCEQGRCTGFATDIWSTLTPEQQQAYVDSVMDAVEAAFPGLHVYVVDVNGATANIDARAVETDDHPRIYSWFPPHP